MNTRNEAATVFMLFLFWIIAMFVAGFPYGNSPIGEMGDYVVLAILIGMGIVTLYCISTKVCDDDPTREKAMRRQIALEKQRSKMLDDDEPQD
ncbi:MAG: hypothetical protein ACTSWA_00460 [Candidatus Thorarchaeota archaeon]